MFAVRLICRLIIMNDASKKNMMSISGMMTIRERRLAMGDEIFIRKESVARGRAGRRWIVRLSVQAAAARRSRCCTSSRNVESNVTPKPLDYTRVTPAGERWPMLRIPSLARPTVRVQPAFRARRTCNSGARVPLSCRQPNAMPVRASPSALTVAANWGAYYLAASPTKSFERRGLRSTSSTINAAQRQSLHRLNIRTPGPRRYQLSSDGHKMR